MRENNDLNHKMMLIWMSGCVCVVLISIHADVFESSGRWDIITCGHISFGIFGNLPGAVLSKAFTHQVLQFSPQSFVEAFGLANKILILHLIYTLFY